MRPSPNSPIPFYVVDAFTREPFAGNPAGVFIDDAAHLTDDQMKKLAGEVHLESAFVTPAPPHAAPHVDFRLRYFTGVMEVPLCGHDTIAAAVVLHQSGRVPFVPGETRRVLHFQTNVGVLRVEIEQANTGGVRIILHQNAPEFGPTINDALAELLLEALGAKAGDAASGLPVEVVSTGTPWLLVPVQSRAVVDNAPADLEAIARLSQETGTFGAYVFTIEGEGESLQTWGRCFAPIAGLNEDPVTGSASGALGCYLARHGVLNVSPNGAAQFTALQGFAGGRGGTVEISVSRKADGVLGVSVAGEAVMVAEGSFHV